MNDLRTPLEDRPYRQTTRSYNDERVISTPEYYRSKFDAIRQHRFFPLASVIAAVVVFGGIISYAYNQGSESGVNATTPTVVADATDYKAKPENPGGMDVPFQDAVVFDQLQSNGQQTASNDAVESLLPPAEEPVAKTETTEATTTTAAATTEATSVDTTTAAKTDTTETPTTTTTTTTSTTAMTDAPVSTGEELAAPNTTTAATMTKTPATTTTTASKAETDTIAKKLDNVAPASAPANTKIVSGDYRIQLGAFRDEAAARAAWTKLQKQFSSQLSSVTPDFPRADLGAKGTFYRVQGTNLSKATAEQLCSSIKAAPGGSCLVTR